MANALPILLAGGAVLLMMSGKKKTKKTPEVPDDIIIIPNDIPAPVIPKNVAMPYWKKAGSTDRGSSYDGAYWGASGEQRLETIRKYFSDFGYQVEVGPWSMNVLGPKGSVELLNQPGSATEKGMLGGGDDEPNDIVKDFQKDYNAVSEAHKFGGTKKMGGLAPDGLVGPYVLNALRFVKENLGGKLWGDFVSEAAKNGYKA